MAKRIRSGADHSMADSNSDCETDRKEPAEKSGRKYDGAAKYRVKYNHSWAKDYPIKAVRNNRYSFFCILRFRMTCVFATIMLAHGDKMLWMKTNCICNKLH